ncbi:hypothetical protein ACHHYP_06673, partial [Achlya hypogyna]
MESKVAATYTLHYPRHLTGAWNGRWMSLPVALPRVHAATVRVSLSVSEGAMALDTAAPTSLLELHGSTTTVAVQLRNVVFVAPSDGSGVATIEMKCTTLDSAPPADAIVEVVVERSVPLLAVCPAKTPSPATSKLWVHTGGAGVDAAPLVGPVTVHSVATPMYDTTKTYTRSLASPAHSGGKIGNGLWVPSKSPKAASPETAPAFPEAVVDAPVTPAFEAPEGASVYTLHYPAQSSVVSMWSGTWYKLPIAPKRWTADTLAELTVVASVGTLVVPSTLPCAVAGPGSGKLILTGRVQDVETVLHDIAFVASSVDAGVASLIVAWAEAPRVQLPRECSKAVLTLHFPAQTAAATMFHGSWTGLPVTLRQAPTAIVEVDVATTDGLLCTSTTDATVEFMQGTNGKAASRLALKGPVAAIKTALARTTLHAPSEAAGLATVHVTIVAA